MTELLSGLNLGGMMARSTASGWLLCILGAFGIWRLYVLARPKMRELEIRENAGLRKEFIEEMAALRAEVADLRVENSHLRDEIRALHGVIDGMRREQLQFGASEHAVLARSVPDLSPEMSRALDALGRVKGVSE